MNVEGQFAVNGNDVEADIEEWWEQFCQFLDPENSILSDDEIERAFKQYCRKKLINQMDISVEVVE